MTRTARAAHPRAVIKDRSESRSGFDNSMRKSGAGQHNWGSVADERELEFQALEDEALELEDERLSAAPLQQRDLSASPPLKPTVLRNSATTDEELEAARNVRKNALKKVANGVLDLSAIARSSVAIAGSPPS